MEGEVLFHEYVQKTEEEKELIRKRLEEKKYEIIIIFTLLFIMIIR